MKQGIRAEAGWDFKAMNRFKVREAQLQDSAYSCRRRQGSGSPQRQRPSAYRRKSGREVVDEVAALVQEDCAEPQRGG